jgi:ABC-type transport system involved in multi-copper enzyme maturation permease subunit
MFKQLYLGELKKLFSLKTAIIMLVLFLAGYAIVGFSMNAVSELSITNLGSEVEEGSAELSNVIRVSESEAQIHLGVNRTLLENAEKEKKELGFKYYTSFLSHSDSIYYYKSQIAIYEYIIENELYDTDIVYYDSTLFALNFLSGQNAGGYAIVMLGVFSFLLTIYALIIGSGAYANEMKNGTLKIVLMNPITRNQLTLAKLLAILTLISAAFLIVCATIVSISYGLYNDAEGKFVYVFNALKAFRAGPGFAVFVGILDVYLSVIMYGIMSFFFGTLTKKRIWGFVIPYGFSLTATLAGLVGIARFWPTNVTSVSGFFGVSGNALPGGNFFLSLPLLIFYLGGMIAGTFFIFNQRDVA